MLEQMHVELTCEHMEAHGSAGGSYEFWTKSGMTLRHDVWKGINFRANGQKDQK